MQLDHLLDQGQSDAAPFMSASACILDAMKPLKESGHLGRWNSGSSVFDLQLHAIDRGAERDGDPPLKRKLERVGEQVENDLLPHLAVYQDPIGQLRAVYCQRQPGPLNGGAKDTCQITGERGEIGRPIRGPRAACLDSRKVEQRAHQPQQPQPVATHDVELLFNRRRHLNRAATQEILDGAEHQSERGSKLMAHITEECRLCAINFCQRLGPPFF